MVNLTRCPCTMEAAWKAVLVESDRRCDLHNRVRDDLQMKANNELKNWQKENYHKVHLKVSLNFCAHLYTMLKKGKLSSFFLTVCHALIATKCLEYSQGLSRLLKFVVF